MADFRLWVHLGMEEVSLFMPELWQGLGIVFYLELSFPGLYFSACASFDELGCVS